MKTVVIYSGGLDSTVLLYLLRAQGDEVLALSVDYGQRHRVELEASDRICARLGIQHVTADLSSMRSLLRGNSQTDSISVPHGHYTAENMKLTVVPNRNMLMLAVAGAWAISNKADQIAYGAHTGDHAIYPDCRPEFVEHLSRALVLADWHQVRVISPFIHLAKWQICKLGSELGVPFEMTYSCYEGRSEAHCGQCGTCVERREAFKLAGVPDPTSYADVHVDQRISV